MVCEKYGKQDIPVVYFDGEVLKFIALAGSNHDEHFYFELKFYGAFLIGEAEGGRPFGNVIKLSSLLIIRYLKRLFRAINANKISIMMRLVCDILIKLLLKMIQISTGKV